MDITKLRVLKGNKIIQNYITYIVHVNHVKVHRLTTTSISFHFFILYRLDGRSKCLDCSRCILYINIIFVAFYAICSRKPKRQCSLTAVYAVLDFVCDVAVFVLKRDVKLQPTNQRRPLKRDISIVKLLQAFKKQWRLFRQEVKDSSVRPMQLVLQWDPDILAGGDKKCR